MGDNAIHTIMQKFSGTGADKGKFRVTAYDTVE